MTQANVQVKPLDTFAFFPGGEKALYKFLTDNIYYPAEAKKNKIEGKVVANFMINKDGSITDIEIVKDIGGGCGAEFLRVLKLMPKWNPTNQESPIGMILPCMFVLPDSVKKANASN